MLSFSVLFLACRVGAVLFWVVLSADFPIFSRSLSLSVSVSLSLSLCVCVWFHVFLLLFSGLRKALQRTVQGSHEDIQRALHELKSLRDQNE